MLFIWFGYGLRSWHCLVGVVSCLVLDSLCVWCLLWILVVCLFCVLVGVWFEIAHCGVLGCFLSVWFGWFVVVWLCYLIMILVAASWLWFLVGMFVRRLWLVFCWFGIMFICSVAFDYGCLVSLACVVALR